MRPSRKEVEIKLRYVSAEAAVREVERMGGKLVRGREFEDNRVYDFPDGTLRQSGRLLRLRTKGPESTLTYKSKVSDASRHKVYIEHETRVDDADETDRVLAGLGYSPWYRYQKYRSVYRIDDVEVCVDETPIGCFVELEGGPDDIDTLAARLGFEPESYIRETYRELHESDASRKGTSAGDLVFSEPAP